MSKKSILCCFIILSVCIVLASPGLVAGQQLGSFMGSKNIVFAPFAFLQYGPDPTQNVPLHIRSAEFLSHASNQTITVPSTIMDTSNTTNFLYSNEIVQPSFDSYFFLNRLLPQVIPNITNMSVSLAKILNPHEATYITQVRLAPAISLHYVSGSNVSMKSFVIPEHIDTGFYLVKLSIYFPEYRINAIYSNSVNIFNASSMSSVLYHLLNNTTSAPYLNKSTSASSSSFGNTTSSPYLNKSTASALSRSKS